MSDLLVLIAPSVNRVYAGLADTLVAAELRVLMSADGDSVPDVSPTTMAGVSYLRIDQPDVDRRLLEAVGRLSGLFALFRRDGKRLEPVEVPRPDLFPDDLVTIPKYPGKTNEQFTRLLLNVAVASIRRPPGSWSILDPMCGRGTTLSTGLMLGHEVSGVEIDVKAIEAYAAFLKTYLRRKRLKHTAEMSPVRREGKSLGRRLEVAVSPPGIDRQLKLTVFSGDTRHSASLYGKRRFDAVVTDAPYGIVHGSHTDVRGISGKRDRSVAGLIGEALPVWAGQLKTGGAFALSWNSLGLSRERLAALAIDAGLTPMTGEPYTQFAHRVDSSVHRDVFVGVKV
ncbi:MAG TPA: site-specific DNA-methyltransferase [Propionibacteriaceae bacterium]|nr:site-specific DNA-methyltransferase [Propionibacteriaceae bacterium]